ncbi:MAG: helix-turn-helix transcriptional regulator [Myxococcales bacterium]|nr:helix-turn-helix transcriptional regulator [Myxococcales bacterium]
MGKEPLACLAIGERLFEARQAAGLGMLALARRAGLANATVNDIEKGRHIPAADTIERLARALRVRAGWLAFGEGEHLSSENKRRSKRTQSSV